MTVSYQPCYLWAVVLILRVHQNHWKGLLTRISGAHLQSFGISRYGVKSESESRSVVSDGLRPHGLYSPWNSPGQNTGVGSHSLLQGIFPTQGLNPGLPHRRQILYQLSRKGSPQGGVGLKNCISDKFQGYIDINGPEITV